jgi:AraC-like DNA-binding protein
MTNEFQVGNQLTLLKIIGKDNGKKNIFYDKLDASFIQFHFCISGSITFNYNKGAYNLKLDEGKFLTLYNPEKHLTIDASLAKNSKVISVLIPIVEFHKLFSSSSSDIPFFENKSLNQKHYSENLISNSILIVLNQIIKNDMDNSTRSLLYKAKIYELFSLIFKKTKEIDLDQCPFLNNDENLKKIAKAKDVILKDIKNPPSLIELSKTIDLSLKNLKKGFKEIYGKPVYKYLFDFKMERAKQLLSNGNLNVNEVSYDLGYSSSSHFIAAFKKKYGITPRTYTNNN